MTTKPAVPSAAPSEESRSTQSSRSVSGRRRASLVLGLIGLLLSVVAAELAARAYWKVRWHVPFRRPGLVLYAFYPGLAEIDRRRPSRHDQFFDVLLLGGSTLYPGFGSVEPAIRERLAPIVSRRVRIFNLAWPGHTSRDGVFQYAAVGASRFDLVILYHGINDASANNAPPEVFKSDYSHFAWYDVLNAMQGYHRRADFALPYTLRYIGQRLKALPNQERYAPLQGPRDEWVRFGAVYRSRQAFETNLRAILERARTVGDRMVLMTSAVYVPKDYSFERFRTKQLDYQLHLTPLELWGEPGQVLGAVAAHNDVVRKLASEYPEAVFVDQANLMQRGRQYFNDAVHFTVLGSALFVDHLITALGSDPEDAIGDHSGSSPPHPGH